MGLQNFRKYQAALRSGAWHRHFGFHGVAGDVNRLAARMGVAKSLTTIGLSEHKPDTALAYTAIFRVFLSFSSLEMLYHLVHDAPFSLKTIESWSLTRDPHRVTDLLRQTSRSGKLIDFLKQELTSRPVIQGLDELVNGTSDNALYFGAAVRHIFAHGAMTANVRGTTSAHLRKLGTEMSDHILRIVDEEFAARVDSYVPRRPGKAGPVAETPAES